MADAAGAPRQGGAPLSQVVVDPPPASGSAPHRAGEIDLKDSKAGLMNAVNKFTASDNFKLAYKAAAATVLLTKSPKDTVRQWAGSDNFRLGVQLALGTLLVACFTFVTCVRARAGGGGTAGLGGWGRWRC